MDRPKIIGLMNIPIGILPPEFSNSIETYDFHNFNDEVIFRDDKSLIIVDENYHSIIDKLKLRVDLGIYNFQTFNFESQDQVKVIIDYIDSFINNGIDNIIVIGAKFVNKNLGMFDELGITYINGLEMTQEINDIINNIKENFDLSIVTYEKFEEDGENGQEYQLYTKKSIN